MAFGAAFDLDLVLVSKHPNWDMHEFARLSTPQGPLWVALESRAGTLDQFITADLPDIDAWMPEIPMERKTTPFTIQDRSNAEQIDVEITYENVDNQVVNVVFQGDPPYREPKRRRNANTLGHAQNQALAVLDVSQRESAFNAKISFDDKNQRVAKVGLFVPFQFAMEQAQGGLAVGSYYTRMGDAVPFESTLTDVVVHAPELEGVEEPEPVAAPEPEVDPLALHIGENRDAIQACYTTAAEANAELAGQLVLSWIVTEGAGSEFNAVLDTLGDEGLATCVTELLGSWEWPEGVDGEVGFPLKFEVETGLVLPGDGEDAEGEDAEGDDAEGEDAEGEASEEAGEDEDLPEGGDDEPEGEGAEDEASEEDGDGEEGDLLSDDPDADDGAVAAARVPQRPQLADFSTFHRMPSGSEVEQKWDVVHEGSRVRVTQRSEFRTLTYDYLVYHDALELVAVTVEQYGRNTPTMTMNISPALPDLRKPFNGRHSSRYVMDINGQRGYHVGTIEAYWTENGPKVKVVPEAPSWTEDRSMVTSIQYIEGDTEVKIERIGD